MSDGNYELINQCIYCFIMNNMNNDVTSTLVAANAINILTQTDDILANIQENEITDFLNNYRIAHKINNGKKKLQKCNNLQQKKKEIENNIKNLIQDKYSIIATLKNDFVQIYNRIYNKKYTQYERHCRRNQTVPASRDHHNTQKSKANQFAFEMISKYFGQIDKTHWSTHQYIHQYRHETNWLFEHIDEIIGFEIGNIDEEETKMIEFESAIGKMDETLLRQVGQWCNKCFSLDNIKRIRSNSNLDKLQELIENDDLMYECIKKIKIDKYDWWFPFQIIIQSNLLFKTTQEKLKIKSMPDISCNKTNEMEEQLIDLQSQIDMSSVNLTQCADINEALQDEINKLEIQLSDLQDKYNDIENELEEKIVESGRYQDQVLVLEEANNNLLMDNDDLAAQYDLLSIEFNKYKENVERQQNGPVFHDTLDLISEESQTHIDNGDGSDSSSDIFASPKHKKRRTDTYSSTISEAFDTFLSEFESNF